MADPGRVTVQLAMMVLLSVAVVAGYGVVAHAPAFSEAERSDGVFGDWRVGVGAAMYDRSAYLFQLGYGLMNADVTISPDTETATELADEETAARRAEKAVAYLRNSLSLAPGNSHAWAALAWALTMQGDVAGGRQAMARSWELAPYNADLAEDRLGYVELITELLAELSVPPLTEAEIAATRRDIATARLYRADALADLAARTSVIAALLRDEGG